MTKKNSIKKIISMILVVTMALFVGTTAFAASGFHKINGVGVENGQSSSYTSTITATCTRLTAQGTSSNNSKKVIIHVYYKNLLGLETIVASGTVTLNGTEQQLAPYLSNSYGPRTYIIRVQSSDTVPYEVSTMFYK